MLDPRVCVLSILTMVFTSVAYYAWQLDPEVNGGVAMSVFAISIASVTAIIVIQLGCLDRYHDHISEPPDDTEHLDPIELSNSPSLRKRGGQPFTTTSNAVALD